MKICTIMAVLPYCSEAEFWDNENDFVKVGEYRNGQLTVYSASPPKRLIQLNKTINNIKEKKIMTTFEELKRRGLLAQLTEEKEI